MTNAIYLTTTEPYSGKSLVSLGITDHLLRMTNRVGIFRPVIGTDPKEGRDKNIELLLEYFNLDQDYGDTYAYTWNEATELISQGRYDEVLDHVIEKYKALDEQYDFVLVIGSDFERSGAHLEFDYNADIAKNLGATALVVTRGQSSGENGNAEGIANTVQVSVDALQERGVDVLGAVVNRADINQVDQIRLALKEEMPDEDLLLAVIPEDVTLSSPTLEEIVDHLDGKVLYGQDKLDNLALRNLIIAMQIHNYLDHLTKNALLITPGDRSDVILSAMQAHRSRNYPRIAGMVLTGGLTPAASVDRLLEGLPNMVPIISVETDTYDTAAAISNVRSYITADNAAKIATSLDIFEEFVDTTALEEMISEIKPHGITPRMFLYNLVYQARSDKQHIVLPEGDDERILRAAEVLINRGIAELTLLGKSELILHEMTRYSLQIDPNYLHIVDPKSSPHFDDYTQTLADLRKHKGMTLELAQDLMTDVSYFGTMMVYKGHADGMVSGAVHTTMHTIRPALQFVKTKPGYSVVSSVFFMALDDKVLVYGDCAINPNPTAEELAEIAISSADTAQAFGIEPKVAMLSYSSGESGKGEDVERVREATRIAQERRPDLPIEGPVQYDAAVDPGVAAKKMPGSRVAGQATVFIFPDLNTGNNTYKAVQRETGAIAIGPVLQGLKKPVNDLSRGCTVEDVINTVAITAVQAQNNE
ncbi:MAG: phosphate acetyltransferase [Chloroflexota bacterium]|nr:phosphate acetyltransferase [Chloroflexota bacterium]